MNRMEEYQALLDEIDVPGELESTANRAIERRKKRNRRILTAVAAVCLLFGAVPFFNRKPAVSPLVITVYSYGEDGDMISKKLELGEKVRLHPATSPHTENFHGYAFDLTLLGSMYVSSCVVDENWEYPYRGGVNYTVDDFHWALTKGNDIITVYEDDDGNIIQDDELLGPKPHGSEIIWRPNDDGLNRLIIKTYDRNLRLTATCYLEITEMDGDYYAEIVKLIL